MRLRQRVGEKSPSDDDRRSYPGPEVDGSFVGIFLAHVFGSILRGRHDASRRPAALSGQVLKCRTEQFPRAKDSLGSEGFAMTISTSRFAWSRRRDRQGVQFSVTTVWIRPDPAVSAENPERAYVDRLLSLGAYW